MPNWCSTALVFEGKKEEVTALYGLMKELEERKEPAVPNGFGTTWLGCLVYALGGDWKKIHCRGEWANVELQGNTLRMETVTAWSPCLETCDFICEKFPSLTYYFRSEEPGMGDYLTNDIDGIYFPERYLVELCTPQEEYDTEYFQTLEEAFEWLEEFCEHPIRSEQDVSTLDDEWDKLNSISYCYLHTYKLT